ncbi:MAG: ABC transporter substrate-binding protein [Myxococcales bacterium]|nr:ABC transporter substrate-binding protein [Myxococcales bacterium]
MPSTTDMLVAFGVWDHVIGISSHCQPPQGSAPVPIVGSGMDPDIEQILALQPDLVVGSAAQSDYEFVRTLERSGITVRLLDDQRLPSLLEDMVIFGRDVGAEEAARAFVDELRASLTRLQQATNSLPTPSVLVVYGHDPIFAAGPDSYVGSILEAAGGENAVPSGDWVQLDRETVVALNPDVILEPTLGEPATVADLRAPWTALTTVGAVRDGRIFQIRSPAATRPGPQIAEAAWEIATILHPAIGSPP